MRKSLKKKKLKIKDNDQKESSFINKSGQRYENIDYDIIEEELKKNLSEDDEENDQHKNFNKWRRNQ